MKDKVERVKSSLQIEEDIDLHVRGWILQRIGWGLMFTFLILAALGFFGDGILSQKEIITDDITVNFERFTRRESDTEIEIIASDRNGSIDVVLSPTFNKVYKIEQILPEPTSQEINNGNTVFEFPAKGQGQITMFLTIRKRVTGNNASAIKVNETDFELNNFIYP